MYRTWAFVHHIFAFGYGMFRKPEHLSVNSAQDTMLDLFSLGKKENGYVKKR
jgi:hypothetical protein